MDSVTVTTKDQLKKAKEDKVDVIHVEGDLAVNLKRSKKVAVAAAGFSGVALAGLIAAIAAAPATGGASFALYATGAGASAATFTGIEVATIILAGSIGITLIVGIYKEYEEIEASTSGGLKLKRKQKTS
ncbi:hypothetical protein LRB91_18070 [Leclercia adecarboxylata]|uniref:hypothetical protein n=1 Tax=Leclercia adecarboxylata TaxID=83655 RepID=UPI0022B7C99E|nr:hypothetical protein [Leclercia adecarboxylata]MCZ7840707.1 hypothetical protein [Leclercia adecarboxylata]